MAKYQKGNTIVDEAVVGTKTPEDWKAQGFSPLSSGVQTGVTNLGGTTANVSIEPKGALTDITPVPKQDENLAGAGERFGVNLAPETPTQPNVSDDLQKNVFSSAQKLGNKALANKEYVNAVFKAYGGRDANQQEILEFTGKGVQDVFDAITTGLSGKKPEVKGGTGAGTGTNGAGTEAPKTTPPTPMTVDEYIKQYNAKTDSQTEESRTNLNKYQTKVRELQAQIDSYDATFAATKLADTEEQIGIKNEARGKIRDVESTPMLSSLAGAKINSIAQKANERLSEKQDENTLRDAQDIYDYTMLTIQQRMYSGMASDAQSLIQSVSDQMFKNETLRINYLQLQESIDARTADDLRQEAVNQDSMRKDGYVYIPQDQVDDMAYQYGASRIYTNPISGKSYLSPENEGADKAPNIQVIGESRDAFGNVTKEYGYFDKGGKLVRMSGSGATPETPDINTPEGQYASFNEWIGSIGTVTQDYDTPVSYFADGRKTHNAIDVAGKMDDPVYSPISGTVIGAESSTGWGTNLVIEDANGNQWRMAHFNGVNVNMGDQINIGDQLGVLGNTGYVLKGDGQKPTSAELATGAGTHLHLEVKDKNGNFINPRSLGQATEKKETPFDLTIKAWAEEKAETGKMPTDVPAHLVGQVSEMAKGITPPANEKTKSEAIEKVKLIDEITKSKGLDSAVGPNFLTRRSWFTADALTGARQEFVGSVQQLISQETLSTLLELKKAGGTLGALSDQERMMLQTAATKIGNWAVKDEGGNVTGYNISEKAFKAELTRMKELATKALVESGQVQTMNDGTVWVKNADGTLTQLN